MHTKNKLLKIFINFLFPESALEKKIEKIDTNTLLKKMNIKSVGDRNTISFFSYKDKVIKDLIWALKYHGRKDVAQIFGEIIYSHLIEELSDKKIMDDFDNPILIPIPITKKKLRKRGFNQSEEIACELVNLDLSDVLTLKTNILKRVEKNKNQAHTENKRERIKNVEDIFYIRHKDKIRDRNIILIDDVVTTGSTLREARKVLKKAGAKNIFAVTVAH